MNTLSPEELEEMYQPQTVSNFFLLFIIVCALFSLLIYPLVAVWGFISRIIPAKRSKPSDFDCGEFQAHKTGVWKQRN